MIRTRLWWHVVMIAVVLVAAERGLAADDGSAATTADSGAIGPPRLEVPDDPYQPIPLDGRETSPGRRVSRGAVTSVQVNIDSEGANILGDAANEPSLAVDPTDDNRIVIGWRQFDTTSSNFRQAGWAYTSDGGDSWTFPGVIEPGVFRSDPVLDAAPDGTIYYNSLTSNVDFETYVFSSADGGATWGTGVYAFGGDKQWMCVDRTGGPGHGHLYQHWSPFSGVGSFNRSVDDGASFETPVSVPETPIWGTSTVAPDGAVYQSGTAWFTDEFVVARTSNAQNSAVIPSFDQVTTVDLGGDQVSFLDPSPNPGGLLGQVWIAADHSGGPRDGDLYLLCSVDPPGPDPLDVHFIRSSDRGATWSAPVRVNDDPVGGNAWQWFGTMAVAPDGRIDVIWNDTRDDPGGYDSELYYAYSTDGGATWSANQPLSPPFDPHLGWPSQNKIGDYSDMVSTAGGVHIAYAATFNGEEDVYYVHLDPPGQNLFSDGFESGDTSAWSTAVP